MERKKRVYDDDDGRTIADMSGVERQRILIPRLPKRDGGQSEAEPPKEQKISKGEERAYVFGALGAALLIGAVFAVAIFLFIFIFLLIYH
jgi:hypothetical protein